MMNVIPEGSRFRSRWDLLILVLIFVSCFLVPFQVGFAHEVRLAGSVLVYLIDLFFLADIVFNFRTTYRHQGVEVVDPERIRRHYRRRMFGWVPGPSWVGSAGESKEQNVPCLSLLTSWDSRNGGGRRQAQRSTQS